MKYKHFYFFTLLIFISLSMKAQQNQQSDNEKPYNIVIKGGHVIDPKNNINTLMDVAIKNGKIALIAKNIDASKGTQVVSATGMYVTHAVSMWTTDITRKLVILIGASKTTT